MLEIPLSQIYGNGDIIPEIIFRMNAESCVELVDLMDRRDWSLKLPNVSGKLPDVSFGMPDRCADFWSIGYEDLVFSVEYDGTEYDLKEKIINELNKFDPDEYAYELIMEAKDHDVNSIRSVCDEAEGINRQCSDLIQAIRASMYC